MELPLEHFRSLFPRCTDSISFVEALNAAFPNAKINSKTRISAFLAQTGHESANYTRFDENLNYSAKALDSVFGKYFHRAGVDAQDYHRQPEKIANRVYASRMGNGDEASGDGWAYRGRGLIQLTGKSNYASFSEDTGINIVGYPDKVTEDKNTIVATAVWYWAKNKLNRFVDAGDFKGLTRAINGGYNGLEHREDLYNKSIFLWNACGG